MSEDQRQLGQEEDDVPKQEEHCYLDTFRRRKLFRACFENIFYNLTLQDLCRLQPVCKWMAEEKPQILDLQKVQPPCQAEAGEHQTPLAELESEYREQVKRAIDALHDASEWNNAKEVDRICTKWYGNSAVLDEEHHEVSSILSALFEFIHLQLGVFFLFFS